MSLILIDNFIIDTSIIYNINNPNISFIYAEELWCCGHSDRVVFLRISNNWLVSYLKNWHLYITIDVIDKMEQITLCLPYWCIELFCEDTISRMLLMFTSICDMVPSRSQIKYNISSQSFLGMTMLSSSSLRFFRSKSASFSARLSPAFLVATS